MIFINNYITPKVIKILFPIMMIITIIIGIGGLATGIYTRNFELYVLSIIIAPLYLLIIRIAYENLDVMYKIYDIVNNKKK